MFFSPLTDTVRSSSGLSYEDFPLVSPMKRKNAAVVALLDKFNFFLESCRNDALDGLFMSTFEGLFEHSEIDLLKECDTEALDDEKKDELHSLLQLLGGEGDEKDKQPEQTLATESQTKTMVQMSCSSPKVKHKHELVLKLPPKLQLAGGLDATSNHKNYTTRVASASKARARATAAALTTTSAADVENMPMNTPSAPSTNLAPALKSMKTSGGGAMEASSLRLPLPGTGHVVLKQPPQKKKGLGELHCNSNPNTHSQRSISFSELATLDM